MQVFAEFCFSAKLSDFLQFGTSQRIFPKVNVALWKGAWPSVTQQIYYFNLLHKLAYIVLEIYSVWGTWTVKDEPKVLRDLCLLIHLTLFTLRSLSLKLTYQMPNKSAPLFLAYIVTIRPSLCIFIYWCAIFLVVFILWQFSHKSQ